MTTLFDAVSADQDESGSPITATGPVQFNLTIDLEQGKAKKARLTIFARTDSAPYKPQFAIDYSKIFTMYFASGTQWYATLEGVGSNDTVSLSYIDA